MRVIGLLLALYSVLVLGLSLTSTGGILLWSMAGGAAAGLVGGAQLAAWRKQGFGPSFVGSGLLLAVGLVFLGARVAFMVEHRGMEGPRGYGSPLAFLIGLAVEQLVFTLPSAGLLLALRREYRIETGAA